MNGFNFRNGKELKQTTHVYGVGNGNKLPITQTQNVIINPVVKFWNGSYFEMFSINSWCLEYNNKSIEIMVRIKNRQIKMISDFFNFNFQIVPKRFFKEFKSRDDLKFIH